MRTPPARFLALLGAALALASCQGGPEITGRVVPRPPTNLPADAVLEVQVADVSSADSAPVVLVRRDYAPLGAAPWTFTLRCEGVRGLDASRAYALQARVLVGGRPRLVSRRRTLVDPARLADTIDVVVEAVPRTVGARVGPPGPAGAGLWNPPGAPATFAAPKLPPIARTAPGPEAAPAIAASPPTTRAECPSRPAP